LKNFVFFLFIIIYSCSDKQIQNIETKNDFYDKAFEFRDKGEIDSSFLFFYKAKDFFIQSKDSFGAGKCIVNMAIILTEKNDYFGGQETSLQAIKYFNPKSIEHKHFLGTNYNNLGIDSYNLKDYKNSNYFYKNAIYFSDNPLDTRIYLNNFALLLQKTKDYNGAITIYSKILKESNKDKMEFARALSNLARTKWLNNQRYNPLPEFNTALKIRISENDILGQNASYSHLADYYSKKKTDSALLYAKKMYSVARELKSPDDQIEALQKLITLENSQNSKHYFQVYQNLSDSLQTARNKAKNQFALIRYETEKNKADFLKAKAESTERQNKIIVRNIIVISLFGLLVFAYFYYRRRQKRLQQEKLLEVKNTELKISKKVHDKVANKIYQLMSQVENKEVIDKDALLFGLENAYETSRDISYENKDINENQSFSEQLYNMLNSYSSDAVKFIPIGNNEKLWEGVSFQNKTEVYLVLQELMTNMKKHSQANIVSIKFSKDNSRINISYTDNGIGIKNLSPKNGLQNMENRINAINGTIIFDTETNNLLKINISFPV